MSIVFGAPKWRLASGVLAAVVGLAVPLAALLALAGMPGAAQADSAIGTRNLAHHNAYTQEVLACSRNSLLTGQQRRDCLRQARASEQKPPATPAKAESVKASQTIRLRF